MATSPTLGRLTTFASEKPFLRIPEGPDLQPAAPTHVDMTLETDVGRQYPEDTFVEPEVCVLYPFDLKLMDWREC